MSKISDIESSLSQAFSIALKDLVEVIRDNDKDIAKKQYVIEIPSPDDMDKPMEELASLVARTSNAYARIARLAGMAKAQYNIAKGRYDRKYKQSLRGANMEERKLNAMIAAEEEHTAMTITEAIYSFADSLEVAARVASESARKLYTQAEATYVASNREQTGSYRDNDFTY